MNEFKRIEDGFKHQKIISLPDNVISLLEGHPITSDLYPTHIGYFPDAKNHYINRPEGAPHSILIFCVDGKGVITIENNDGNHYEIALEKGQLYILKSSLAHSYSADLIAPWTIYWAHFTGSSEDVYRETLCSLDQSISIHPASRPEIIRYFNDIIHMMELGFSLDHLLHVSNLFKSLLTCANHQTLIHSEITKKVNTYISDTILYMQDNLHRRLTLEDIANHVSLSKNRIMVLFKERTTVSPIDYFISMKMQKACEFLCSSDITIKNIAISLGYDDPYYFSRLFKTNMGMSPKAYREKIL